MDINEIKRLCPEFAEAIDIFRQCNLPTEHEASDEIARENFLSVAQALAEARKALQEVAFYCEKGSVFCAICGHEETLHNLDFMDTVRKALQPQAGEG